MLAIVVFLLILGLLVRNKWRNAAAKKEEILRLVALTSEEEAEIAKLQAVEEYSLPHPVQPQIPRRLEKRYCCAVCYSPTTTRCSKCKAVRYCSGKCQIMHWRQGHKVDCRPGTSLHAGKEFEHITETTLQNQSEMHLNGGAKIWLRRTQELDDSGSSSSSLPFFTSSADQSETSFDASTSEVFELGTPMKQDLPRSACNDSPVSQSTHDSDNADVPNPSSFTSTVYSVSNKVTPNKIKKLATKTDEGFELIITKDKRKINGSTMSEEFEQGKSGSRTYQSNSSVRTSTADAWNGQAPSLPNKEKRSLSVRGPGSHQFSNVELRSSQCSKSLKTSQLDESRKNEAQLCNHKEARSMSFRSSNNYPKVYAKADSHHALPSEGEVVRLFSQPTSKGLKTSMRKFVHHFRAPKQSKSGTFDTGKDSGESYNDKVIFPVKLFMQLYTCDSVEIQPFGLANYGNSCYANAVLQCLTFTRPFTSYLLQGFHTNSCRKRDCCFICEFERLISKGQEMNFPLSPVKIMSQIPMIGSHLSHGREEDAHEFLRNVVDKMQSIFLEEAGVSGSWAEDSTLVGLTFGGYLRSKIKCMKCFERSERCDRMMDLTVEIDGNTYTLEEALAQFTTSEILGGDDKYKCSRCKSYEEAKKKLTVLEAPNILTIVLKRFQSGNLEKLNKLVEFPEVLNLAPYMSGKSDKYLIYHLYAVVVHLGMNAAYSGHYVSYVKDYRGDWFRIDDSRVSPVDLETVLSVEAYILFYARHTPRVGPLMRTSSAYSDGKTKRSTEAISSSISAKEKNSKSKSSSAGQSMDPTILHERSEKHHYWISPNDFTSNHVMDPQGSGIHRKHQNIILDSSSDCSSIFSTSDAGSYSTDSTKDSSSEEMSGYLFGSSWYQP